MKFQIPEAQYLFGILASRTFQINMLAEILRLFMLIEKNKMLLKNELVGNEFNQYFEHITNSLDLCEFPYEKVCEGLDDTGSNLEII